MCVQLTDLEQSCAWVEVQLLLQKGKLSQAWSALSGGERQRAIIACGVILSCPLAVMLLREAPDATVSPLSSRGGEGSGGESLAVVQGSGHFVTSIAVPPSTAILLLDEPTAACDALSCAAVERLLIVTGVACIVVTHDERQAIRLATTRIILA